MIYTVTLNPSLDYFVTVDGLELGKTNRAKSELMLPGGKGINVSIVLKNLGVENTALGFAAGFVGREISKRIEEQGVRAELIPLKEGNSRINVKIKNIEGTEINGIGPVVSKEELAALMEKIARLQPGDFLVLAGSIPTSVPSGIYGDMMKLAALQGAETVVDATGDALRQVLFYRPFLIKPNKDELGELFGVEIKGRREAVPYAEALQKAGARNVLVSFAGEGALLLTENGQMLEMDAPKGTFVNGVGAGDSMVAGFLTGWLEAEVSCGDPSGWLEQETASGDTFGAELYDMARKRRYERAFRMSVCAGSASAFSENLATRAEVEALMNKKEA